MTSLASEKLTIVGATGIIGSNVAQTALSMGLTNDIYLYDVLPPKGVAEEVRQNGLGSANIVTTTDVKEALTDVKYIISSGGASRKAGMTYESLLKGNCGITEGLGRDIEKCCPDVKYVVIIFSPVDLVGLITLLYSGSKPSQVTTSAALDSTRLQSALAKKFSVIQTGVKGIAAYSGYDEQMTAYGSHVIISGKPLTKIISAPEFISEKQKQMKKDVTKDDAKIIELHGRSSLQSPVYLSIEMIRSVIGDESFRFPIGTYISTDKYDRIMMAMKTMLGKTGIHYKAPQGTDEEDTKLDASYEYLCEARDELVTLNIVLVISEWSGIGPNL